MAQRKISPYVKVYSFGANGAATLAGRPQFSEPQRTRRASGPERRRRVTKVSASAALIAMAALLTLFAFMYLDMHAQVTGMAKQGDSLMRELRRVQDANALLEINLEKANDPARIHAIAVNTLGMYQPTEDQIHRMPRPVRAASAVGPAGSPAQTKSVGLFSIVRQVFGW